MSDFQAQRLTVGTDSYTPIANDSVLIGLLACNTGATQATVTINVGPSGSETALVKDIIIPVGSSLSALDGKIVLNASENITATCTGSVELHISLLELP